MWIDAYRGFQWGFRAVGWGQGGLGESGACPPEVCKTGKRLAGCVLGEQPGRGAPGDVCHVLDAHHLWTIFALLEEVPAF